MLALGLRMKVVGLTGDSGSGRRTVRGMLEEAWGAGRGFTAVDVDAYVARRFRRGTPAYAALLKAAKGKDGADELTDPKSGELRPRAVREMAFRDPGVARVARSVDVAAALWAHAVLTWHWVLMRPVVFLVKDDLFLSPALYWACAAVLYVDLEPEARARRMAGDEGGDRLEEGRARALAEAEERACPRKQQADWANFLVYNAGSLEITRGKVDKLMFAMKYRYWMEHIFSLDTQLLFWFVFLWAYAVFLPPAVYTW